METTQQRPQTLKRLPHMEFAVTCHEQGATFVGHLVASVPRLFDSGVGTYLRACGVDVNPLLGGDGALRPPPP